MIQKYYLSTFMKAMMIFAVLLVVFTSAFFLLIREFFAVDIPGVIFFAVIDTALIAFIIWRLRTPIIEISETGFKVNIPVLFKSKFAKWDDVAGMVVEELSTFGRKEKSIKLLLKSEKAKTEEIIFGLKAVEKADEIIAKLRGKIPEAGYEKLKHFKVLQMPVTKAEVKYREWALTKAGIKTSKETISWEDVKGIKYSGFVIAGYGATTINYISNGGKENRFTVRPKAIEEYQDFIRYLIQHSKKASVDPGLLKVLEYSPKDAKADIASIPLFLIGTVLLFIAISFLNYYSPTVSSGNIYPLLVLPFVVIPMGMTIKLMAGRFRGKTEPASKKLLWSALVSISPVLAMLTFFILSPFSMYWFIGDIFNKTGNLNKAEAYYEEALERYPESMDILYEMGKLYRERKEWDIAFEYLKKAYEQDPSYWGPKAVVLAPDTLMKMGKYDEALELSKEILKNHPNKIDIARAINRKQDEIISEKELHKRRY